MSSECRAAKLVQAGARSDLRVLDEWLERVDATSAVQLAGEIVPGGLAIKLFPCCYAMQRPIGAMRVLRDSLKSDTINRITITTPRGTVHPLIHSRPKTGLEGKFSLEYSLAAALLDGFPGFGSFTDDAVLRAAAQTLIGAVDTRLEELDVDNLLAGDCELEVESDDGSMVSASLAFPPGSPQNPATEDEFAAKIRSCGENVPGILAGQSGTGISWIEGATLLRDVLPCVIV